MSMVVVDENHSFIQDDIEPLPLPKSLDANTPPSIINIDPFASPVKSIQHQSQSLSRHIGFPTIPPPPPPQHGSKIRVHRSKLRALTIDNINPTYSSQVSESFMPDEPPQPRLVPISNSLNQSHDSHDLYISNNSIITGLDRQTSVSSNESDNDDSSLPSMKELLLNEMDDSACLSSSSSLDLEEYGIIEALNHTKHDLRLDTLSLIKPLQSAPIPNQEPVCSLSESSFSPPDKFRIHSSPTRQNHLDSHHVRMQIDSNNHLPSPSQSPSLFASQDISPHISPLSVMDPPHLACLAKTYAIAISIHGLYLSTSMVAAIHKSTGYTPSVTGLRPSSASLTAKVTFVLPKQLGTRSFMIDVRHSTITRAQRNSTVKSDPASGSGVQPVPSIYVPTNQTDPIPLSFTGQLVQTFIQNKLIMSLEVLAQAPLFGRRYQATAGSGAGLAASARRRLVSVRNTSLESVVGETSIPLVKVLQDDLFTCTSHFPVFTNDIGARYMGAVHVSLSLLPTPTRIDLAKAASSMVHRQPSSIPLLPSPPPLVIPEPPIPIDLVVSIGTYTPISVPQPISKIFPSTGTHAHSLSLHLSSSLFVIVRAHMPLETVPVQWTSQTVNQIPGVVMDHVNVASSVVPVNFEAHFVAPVSMAQLNPWSSDVSMPLVVELWSMVTQRTVHPANTSKDLPISSNQQTAPDHVHKELLGIAKLPLGQLMHTILKTYGTVSWAQVLPVLLNSIDCSVIDHIQGVPRGWLTASLSVQPRPRVLVPHMDASTHTFNDDRHHPIPTPLQAHAVTPSARLLIRVHSAGGMWTLIEHVLRQILEEIEPDSIQTSQTPQESNLSNQNQTIQKSHCFALKRLLLTQSPNLFVELKVLPQALSRQLGLDPSPIVTQTSWNSPIPRWDEADPGHELSLHDLDEYFMSWMESPKAVATGKIWHRFTETDSDAEKGSIVPIPDILVGTFHIELSRLVKRSSGLRDIWAAVHVPESIGPESGIHGLGPGIPIPHLSETGCIHLDLFFLNTITKPLNPFPEIRVQLALHIDVRSNCGESTFHHSYIIGVDLASVFGHKGKNVQFSDPMVRPFTWTGVLLIDSLVLQQILNGRMKITVCPSDPSKTHVNVVNDSQSTNAHTTRPLGTAFCDTFTLAHAVLGLVTGAQHSDRVEYQLPMCTTESMKASALSVLASFILCPSPYESVENNWICDNEMHVQRESPLVDHQSVSKFPSQHGGIVQPHVTIQPDPKLIYPEPERLIDYRNCLDLEIMVEEAVGFQVMQSSDSGKVFITFAWSADTNPQSMLALSVLTFQSSQGLHSDRQLFATESTEIVLECQGTVSRASWTNVFHVKQSTSLQAMQLLQRKKVIVFKLWQTSELDPTNEERWLIGICHVDVSPLAHGLPEINGWYNITSFHDLVMGQLHVHVRHPDLPLPSVYNDTHGFEPMDQNPLFISTMQSGFAGPCVQDTSTPSAPASLPWSLISNVSGSSNVSQSPGTNPQLSKLNISQITESPSNEFFLTELETSDTHSSNTSSKSAKLISDSTKKETECNLITHAHVAPLHNCSATKSTAQSLILETNSVESTSHLSESMASKSVAYEPGLIWSESSSTSKNNSLSSTMDVSSGYPIHSNPSIMSNFCTRPDLQDRHVPGRPSNQSRTLPRTAQLLREQVQALQVQIDSALQKTKQVDPSYVLN